MFQNLILKMNTLIQYIYIYILYLHLEIFFKNITIAIMCNHAFVNIYFNVLNDHVLLINYYISNHCVHLSFYIIILTNTFFDERTNIIHILLLQN